MTTDDSHIPAHTANTVCPIKSQLIHISTSSVGRIWGAFELQPHRVETFKLSTDPLFVSKSLPWT